VPITPMRVRRSIPYLRHKRDDAAASDEPYRLIAAASNPALHE